jgi:hypothetical protein
MHRRCKHTFLTIERLYFIRGPCEVATKGVQLRNSSRLEFQAASLQGIESSELAVAEQWQERN